MHHAPHDDNPYSPPTGPPVVLPQAPHRQKSLAAFCFVAGSACILGTPLPLFIVNTQRVAMGEGISWRALILAATLLFCGILLFLAGWKIWRIHEANRRHSS
ncbi:MAG: hypothetical protein U1A77_10470 [Pirellulales bacterium]